MQVRTGRTNTHLIQSGVLFNFLISAFKQWPRCLPFGLLASSLALLSPVGVGNRDRKGRKPHPLLEKVFSRYCMHYLAWIPGSAKGAHYGPQSAVCFPVVVFKMGCIYPQVDEAVQCIGNWVGRKY